MDEKAFGPLGNDDLDLLHIRRAETAVKDAHAVALVTEWPEFKELDWARVKGLMKTPILVDARNCLDPEAMTKLGFLYQGIGRSLPRKP